MILSNNKLNIRSLTFQSLAGLFFNFAGIIITYAYTPLLITRIGLKGFGLWETLISLGGWLILLDFGIGTGLQNRLVDLYTPEGIIKSKQYISAAYSFLLITSLIISFFLFIFIYTADTALYLDATQLSEIEINKSLAILILFSMLNLFLKPYVFICNALHLTSLPLLIPFMGKFLFFLCLVFSNYLFPEISFSKLIRLYYLLNFILILAANIITFTKNPAISPGWLIPEKDSLKKLLNESLPFFIIHISYSIIVTSDKLIISSRIGSEEVAVYSLVYKIIFLGKMVYIQLLYHLWPHLTQLYHDKNKGEINKFMTRYRCLARIINTGIIGLSFFVPLIIRFWTAADIHIPLKLIVVMTIYVIIDNEVCLPAFCLNAFGKLKLKMRLYIIGALLNIPLSIILSTTALGSSGVVLSSIICYLPLLFLIPRQVKKEIDAI